MPRPPCSSEAGVGPGAVQVLFTGADRGVEGGRRAGLPAQPDLAEALARRGRCSPRRSTAPLRRPSTASRCGSSSPAGTAMTNGQVAAPDHPPHRAVRRLPAGLHLPARTAPRTTRATPRDPHPAELAHAPPWHPRVRDPPAVPPPRPLTAPGRAWSGTGPGGRVAVSTDGGASWATARLATASRPPGPGQGGASTGRGPRRPTSAAPAPPTPPATPTPPHLLEHWRLRQPRGPPGRGHGRPRRPALAPSRSSRRMASSAASSGVRATPAAHAASKAVSPRRRRTAVRAVASRAASAP